jgi:Fe-S cluster assembly ATPase SufC
MADLEIRNLHVAAGDKQILKGVDLHVRDGEFHALMGPNGSGKSTLANAIMGHPNFEVTSRRPTPTSARARGCSWPSSTPSRSRA